VNNHGAVQVLSTELVIDRFLQPLALMLIGFKVICKKRKKIMAGNLELSVVSQFIDDINPDDAAELGEKIKYIFTVKNNGSDPVENVTVTDSKIFTSPYAIGNLASGEEKSFIIEYDLKLVDLDFGQVGINAQAQGLSGGNIVQSIVFNDIEEFSVPAAIDISKSFVKFADANNNQLIQDPGDTIEYSYQITNNSSRTARNVVLKDVFTGVDGTKVIAIEGLTDEDGDGIANDLGIGKQATAKYLYEITQIDANTGRAEGDAKLTGTARDGTELSGSQFLATPITAKPNALLTKIAGNVPDQADAFEIVDAAGNPSNGKAGDTIKYSYKVKNTGNVTLSNLKLVDDNGTPTDSRDDRTIILKDNSGNIVTSLAASETAIGSYDALLTQAIIDAGTVKNTATFTATPARGSLAPKKDDETVTIAPKPAIDVTKAANPTLIANAQVGDAVTYSYQLINTGNVSLLNVTLVDDNGTDDVTDDVTVLPLAGLTDLDGDQVADDLAIGAIATATYGAKLTQKAIDAGVLKNIVVGTGFSPKGVTVQDEATATVTITAPLKPPAIQLLKTAGEIQDNDGDGNPSAGDTVVYTYEVTNIGPVNLFNVRLSDDNGTPNILDDDFDVEIRGLVDLDRDGQLDDLAIGGKVFGYYTKTLTEDNICDGSFTNIGTVEGFSATQQKVMASDPETILLGRPAITLEKCAELDLGDDCVANPGDLVKYTFHVTNTGTVTLNSIAIIDPQLGNTPIEFHHGVTSLALGECVDAFASYRITQADIDNGSLKNWATAYGNPPNGNPRSFDDDVKATAEADICIPQCAEIVIDKVTVYGDKSGEYLKIPVGSAIDWQYTITNRGNVTLSNIELSDQMTGAVSSNNIVSRSLNDDNLLDVGETWVYKVAGKATKGNYCSDGTVTGYYKDCGGGLQSVSATDWNDYIGYNPKPVKSSLPRAHGSKNDAGSTQGHRWESRKSVDCFGDRPNWSNAKLNEPALC
jgi:large repetitive protein